MVKGDNCAAKTKTKDSQKKNRFPRVFVPVFFFVYFNVMKQIIYAGSQAMFVSPGILQ